MQAVMLEDNTCISEARQFAMPSQQKFLRAHLSPCIKVQVWNIF